MSPKPIPDGGRTDSDANHEWRAGAATRVITPNRSMRLAGFSARTDPADGTMMDLHAKAVAFEDEEGSRAVVVSAEVLAITRGLRDDVTTRVEEEYDIDTNGLVLNATHTHYGPEFRESRFENYGLSEEERSEGRAYRNRLADELVGVIGEAITALEPVSLQYGHARCGIGMNRRLPTSDGIRFRQAPDGPVDHDVPVLAAYRDGDPTAILFGYACHPTCLPLLTEYSGDWVGHAMENLEEYYEEATAAFVQGCGGDIKAYPQNTRELSAQHGRTLSNSVRAALDARTTTVRGSIETVYEEITLEFEGPPSRTELEADLESDDEFERRRARMLLDQLEERGEISTEHPYPVQALGFGDGLTMVAMGGEVLVEYSQRLEDRLEGNVWPLGYSNDGFTYVPTERATYEGGYEGGDAIRLTPFPGPLPPETEDRIVGTALSLAERVGSRRVEER
ncbi:neutral/alkaline non-lysosomal ceramidase N-terminal domain-containing protein [Halomontanus rarus]|uniref:neutral/alkaline non-lysosomal ceramidase N-terminal domain-containing protein n=1 Tax=Halomontanus rarus TaxID=3034020 RepID=UPI0023E8CA86|nr:neutral/alkaline non-lysosomal ceramidase N-terminal domain-containing protein [Halovivax sp. TS33]